MKFKLAFIAITTIATVGVTSCSGSEIGEGYTYQDFTVVSPSNWNELTYQDQNDTQIMNYIGSSFFTYNFQFDSNGEIIPGAFDVQYSAATSLKDVTSTYAADSKWNIPSEATKNYAYEITLRDDLKWEDGTAIMAEDFVYSMKEQLNPDFQNYRADSFYNSAVVIHNAENYVKQGRLLYVDNYIASKQDVTITLEDLTKGADGVYSYGNSKAKFNIENASNWCEGHALSDYKGKGLNDTAFAELMKHVDKDGYASITDETIDLLIQTISTPEWGETSANVPCYIVYEVSYPKMDFDSVGIFVGDTPYQLVLILDSPLSLLKEDGSLSYQAAYYLSSLPLVNKQKYEANKVAPVAGTNTLWTSTYNSSVASTSSWGPYRLTEFQAGKSYVLERNDHWYGYQMKEYEGQYQTDKIVCETIAEYETQLMKFKKGELTTIGIDVSVADTYKNSEQAIYTPDDYVGSLQLQSNKQALKERESTGINKTILSYDKFRKAISLSIDRVDYNKVCTTSSKAGYGLFNSMHYYNVEEGLRYRDTEAAKKTLCSAYAVNPTQFESLDQAVESITGYNPALAKELVTSAYQEALSAGDIQSTDKVEITFGASAITEASTRQYQYLANCLVEMVKGTPLEGRLVTKQEDHGSKWANDFRAGGYDVCIGGWSGSAWDPGYFLLAYLSPDYMYSSSWDTAHEKLEFTAQLNDGTSFTATLSLMEWYNCLNGISGCVKNLSKGFCPDSTRIELIAILEKAVLEKYYTIPIQNYYSSALLSYKVNYITRDYNTFMSYGGIRYMTYNYNDSEWARYVKKSGGEINYTA